MELKDRIEAFSQLGEILRDSLAGINATYSQVLNNLIENQHLKNPWFTPVNVRKAIDAISSILTKENLNRWCSMYPQLEEAGEYSRVGIIMAGNIPLVGFHDLLTVLISGNNLIAKTSSKDPDLMPFIASVLFNINPEFRTNLGFSDKLTGFDKIIATGSDNSSRYFEYYFGKYPRIIRKNRNSVGIISGDETDEDLKALGDDVFSYFGLGCRNVSKLYVPEGYDFNHLVQSWSGYSDLVRHHKYANNLDFSKAVYLVNRDKFTDAGFVLLKESPALLSPVAVVYFEYYASLPGLERVLEPDKEKIQLICGKNHTPFGKAQSPSLWDYSDGTDTMAFLLKKKS
jgi:hypothetical protein